MFRRFIRHPRTQTFLARLLGRYLVFVYATTRWRLLGEAHLAAARGAQQPLLVAFWHERLPMMPMLWVLGRKRIPTMRSMGAHVLVSRHRDGRFIGDIVARFRLSMVYASSSKGGATGLRHLLRLLAAGEAVAITPDGPRGPRRQAAAGVAQLAALADVPVLPTAAAVSRARLLGSWDRMMLPLPFARGVVVVGAPVTVQREEPLAALALIEAGLNSACAEADAGVGRVAG